MTENHDSAKTSAKKDEGILFTFTENAECGIRFANIVMI